MISRVFFSPFSAVSGIVAGMVGKRLFQRAWGLVDQGRPPKADERSVSTGRLALALLLEGALFSLVKGLAQHGSRRAFAHMTGSWPGQRTPEGE